MKGYDPTTGLGYDQEGDNITVALPYARNPGEAALIGSIFGVCVAGGASGASDTLVTEGIFYLPAATGTGTDATAWAKAYWDNTNRRITPVASGNTYVATFASAKLVGEATARVRLNGFIP